MTDVSPVEQIMNVTLSSDEITDLGRVNVSRWGKNLFNITKLPGVNNFIASVSGIL